MQVASFVDNFQVYLSIWVPACRQLFLMDFPVPYKDDVTFCSKITT